MSLAQCRNQGNSVGTFPVDPPAGKIIFENPWERRERAGGNLSDTRRLPAFQWIFKNYFPWDEAFSRLTLAENISK